MDLSIVVQPNVIDFLRCALELVLNSLNAKTSAIAIRVDKKIHKIQVIDNGIGIPLKALESIAECNTDNTLEIQRNGKLNTLSKCTLTNIRCAVKTLIITSRYFKTADTYMKIFKVGDVTNIVPVELRPSHGTTVTIYGFRDLAKNTDWDISTMCLLVSCFAVINPEISFSVRDDDCGKITLGITKSQETIQILSPYCDKEILFAQIKFIKSEKSNTTFHGYVGITKTHLNAKFIFVNNRPVHCPTITEFISTTLIDTIYSLSKTLVEKNTVFILLFLMCQNNEFIFVMENGISTLLFYKIHDLLNNIRKAIVHAIADDACYYSTYILENLTRYKPSVVAKPFVYSLKQTQKSVINHITTHDFHQQTFVRSKKTIACILKGKNKNSLLRSVKTILSTNLKDGNRTLNYLLTTKNITYNPIRHTVCKSSIKRIKLENYGHSVKKLNKQFTLQQKCAQENTNKRVTLFEAEHTDKVHISSSSFENSLRTNKHKENETDFLLVNSINQLSISSVTSLENMNATIKDCTILLSQWSNWSYRCNNDDNETISNQNVCDDRQYKCLQRFDFMPQQLNSLLQYNKKLTDITSLNISSQSIISAELKYGLPVPDILYHQEMDVRPCKLKQKLYEFRLTKQSLKSIRILGQINKELIAGIIIQDDREVLLFMDQHAVHERIRYENLLTKYKPNDKAEFSSVILENPITINIPSNTFRLLSSSKKLLLRFGISCNFINNNTVIINSVPLCFTRNTHTHDAIKILSNVQSLFNEIEQNFADADYSHCLHNFPLVIYNVIAVEACHGAIKFGDPLTLEQCESLLKSLQNTRSPTRCAHGRPSIIPILELEESEKKQKCVKKAKLNFSALKVYRRGH